MVESFCIHSVKERYRQQFRSAGTPDSHITHDTLESIIASLSPDLCTSELIGSSVAGKAIHHISLGSGAISVLLCSQMHGDEPTATLALLDLLSFLGKPGIFREVRDLILTNLQIHIIPMLNPDGANRNSRRNLQGIDVNRDALTGQSPEARALLSFAESVPLDWMLNLHEQSRYYGVDTSCSPVAFAFLAPRCNMDCSFTSNRARAASLVLDLHTMLQRYTPRAIGRYDDSYEPRAFGEFFQSRGVATVLMEGGYIPRDPEKNLLTRTVLSFTSELSLPGCTQGSQSTVSDGI